MTATALLVSVLTSQLPSLRSRPCGMRLLRNSPPQCRSAARPSRSTHSMKCLRQPQPALTASLTRRLPPPPRPSGSASLPLKRLRPSAFFSHAGDAKADRERDLSGDVVGRIAQSSGSIDRQVDHDSAGSLGNFQQANQWHWPYQPTCKNKISPACRRLNTPYLGQAPERSSQQRLGATVCRRPSSPRLFIQGKVRLLQQ